MEQLDPRLEGLAFVLPVLRDASLLLLLNRVLRAGQTAAELMYSSRILSTQRRELWQNTRERRVIACLLAHVMDARNGDEPAAVAVEPLDANAPLAFERACAELITAGSPGSDLWLGMVKLSEEPSEESESSASEEHSPTRRGQADILRQEGILCEPKKVEKGATALFRSLVPEGRLSFAQLTAKLQDGAESERFWQLLEALDAPANFKRPRPHRALSRANTAPIDEASPTPKSRRLGHTKSSGHIEISVGQDAFVQLVVSTYKDSARLVSNVGEHSAIFALFCSVLRLCRLVVVSIVALGRFAPASLMQTLSWLISSVLLAVSFAWGPVLLDVMQSLVLLLHVCPFDTGDRIVFRGQVLVVAHIKLLNTVFRDVYDEEIYIRNAALYAGDGIINLRRSGPAYVAITLVIPLKFAKKEIFKALTVAAKNYAMSHQETWREQITCGFFPTEQGAGGVEVHMESFPSQALRWRVGVSHQLSKLHSAQVRSDASLFLTELIEEAEQCPAIFSEIDVRRCTKDASRPAVISVLQRYAAAKSPPEAVEGLRNLAAEDAAAAAQLCADKIAALPSDAVLDHARDLVAALLDAIRLEKLPELSKVLELFLQRTQSWRSGEDKSQQAQPVIHSMVVDHLLSTPRLHGLLDVMVSNSNAVAWAEILQLRANKSRMAAELLWRYHQQRGQVRPEWAQLQRLVETTQAGFEASNDENSGFSDVLNMRTSKLRIITFHRWTGFSHIFLQSMNWENSLVW
ncbi:unnamed protein product [Cladocopium goreaui]|uniref:Mechanosensitive ion channel protein 10 (Mechanosensitive channel of small conductance-like 10) (MscS-Like protein 10) (AtMSL10) n=1 Tax=Cladocopium goreaui TaxID=2562237 RepID=A0A9P1FYC7_9DINO|nr:unnamed protein product [Cladocopium goreaui]